MEHTAYIERVRQILKDRSNVLHRAGSIRRGVDEAQRDQKRQVHESTAIRLTDDLVDTVLCQFPDRRPEPQQELFYNGKRFVIQRYDGINCTYVAEDKFDADKYVYKRIDYRDHIVAELSRH